MIQFPTRLYVLGPMTGYFNDNRHSFQLATKHLRNLGFEVVSPDELDDISPAVQQEWSSLLHRDIPYLLQCGGGAALPGWRHSRGASLESINLASLGKPIFEIPDPSARPYTLDDLSLVSSDRLPRIIHPSDVVLSL